MSETTRESQPAPRAREARSTPERGGRTEGLGRAMRHLSAGAAPPADALGTVMRRAGNRAVQRLMARRVSPRSVSLPGPVQMHAAPGGAVADGGAVRAAAAKGIATPGRALPHRATLQRAFGRHRIDGLKAHISPEACDAMGARAYATGRHLVFAGQPTVREVAHEAAHALQQRGGLRLPGGVGRAGDRHEAHADAVADGVARGRSVAGLLSRYGRPGAPSRALAGGPVQRKSMKDHRLEARARSVYDRKALEFELALGKRLNSERIPNEAAELMLARVERIVNAWAEHSGQKLAAVYEEEFNFPGGEDYYGAFLMTARNINAVFKNAKKQPLRIKLKLIYNAVRNNNLSKWLRVAADDITGGFSKDLEVYHKERDDHKSVHVRRGFAKTAGLDKLWRRGKLKELSEISEREKEVPFGLGRKVHTHSFRQRSDVLKWKGSTMRAHGDRTGGIMSGVPLKHQRTMTFSELPDISTMELQQLKSMGHRLRVPKTKRDMREFKRSHRDDKVMWSQGSMYYRVDPDSSTARHARSIRAHLESGISGSTDLMMHAAENLGMYGDELYGLRLAMLAWMLPNRDHSFYEIMRVTEDFGMAFVYNKSRPGMEYQHPVNFQPMHVKNFSGLLPEKKFPAYFLGPSYRRTLEGELHDPGASQTAMRDHFMDRGLSVIDMLLADKEELALLDALEADMDRILGEMRGSDQNRTLALDGIKRTPGYTDLAAAGKPAETYMTKLLYAAVDRELGAVGLSAALLPGGAQAKHLVDVLFVIGSFRDATFTGDRANDAREVRRLRGHSVAKWLHGVLDGVFDVIVASLLRRHGAGVESAGFDLMGTGHVAGPVISRGLPDFLARSLSTSVDVVQLGQVFDAIELLVDQANGAAVANTDLDQLAVTYSGVAGTFGTRKFKTAVAGHVVRRGGIFEARSIYARYAEMERLRTPGAITESAHEIDTELKRSRKRRRDSEEYNNQAWLRQSGLMTTQLEDNIRKMGVDWAGEHADTYRGLSPGELMGINAYSRLGGMGEWQDALRDMSPGKKQGDLGGLTPLIKAAISGLQRLPAFGGTVYHGRPFDATKGDAMETIRANFPIGRVVRHDNFLSAAKTFGSSFGIKGGYDLVWEISDLKTGRDIQPISTNFGEEEVLFPPGVRLMVYGAYRVADPLDERNGKIVVRMSEV